METKQTTKTDLKVEQDRTKPCLNIGCGHWKEGNANGHCKIKATDICKCFISKLRR
jgi:hypothetical protein